MKHEELLYTLALTRIPGLGLIGARRLLLAIGDRLSDLFINPHEVLKSLPESTHKLEEALKSPETLRLCEAELAFAEKNKIRCLSIHDEDYPSRLRDCEDAPLVLFYKGNADLNRLHVVSMVGTRHATDYGKDLCTRFIRELKELVPDVLIVSGLAYGIDICSHRAALQYGADTIGVLAHGLDRIYPAVHRLTAAEMIGHGGLLTEYPSGTNPDRQNFIRRNRIVAGISDATLVVESAEKGGALITADIADSYHRDCFAFPGRISDLYSAGCNNLIKTNRAALVQNAEDFVKAMNWVCKEARPAAIQRQLFPDLNEEESMICSLLEKNPDGMQLNNLVVAANIPVNRLAGIMLELELKGVVRTAAGGMYRILL